MATIRSTHGSTVARVAANPLLEGLERVGYAARGLLYLVMGSLAFKLALGSSGGQAADMSDTLKVLLNNPFGKVLMFVMVLGLAAYSVWGFVRAIFDPLHRGDDAPGIAARIGFVMSGLSWGAVAFLALQLAVGSNGPSAAGGSFFAQPLGRWLTLGIGLVALGIGLGQFIEARRNRFARDLKTEEMTTTEKDIAVALGRYGVLARGLTFAVMGWLFLLAGIRGEGGGSPNHIYGGAFLYLLSQPYGHLLLGVTALGFVALGLHSIACARWVRLVGSAS